MESGSKGACVDEARVVYSGGGGGGETNLGEPGLEAASACSERRGFAPDPYRERERERGTAEGGSRLALEAETHSAHRLP